MLIFRGATYLILLSDNLTQRRDPLQDYCIHDDGAGFVSSCDHNDPIKPLDEHCQELSSHESLINEWVIFFFFFNIIAL